MSLTLKTVIPLEHHLQNDVCVTRPKYRQGRKETAVKVYTINQESKYLLIIGVPSVGAKDDLENLCSDYGTVINSYPLDDYPCEEFTETYLVCFDRLQSARIAKRKLDSRSFFGGCLHVCYAPEFETVEETRNKLIERQKYVSIGTKSGFCGPWDITRYKNVRNTKSFSEMSVPSESHFSASEATLKNESETYIWAGKTYKLSDLTGHTDNIAAEHQSTIINSSETRVLDLVPRQLKRKNECAESSNTKGDDGSQNAMDVVSKSIRNKLYKLSTQNPDVVFK